MQGAPVNPASDTYPARPAHPGEIPFAPGTDAEMLKKKRKAKSRVFSLPQMRKKQAESGSKEM